MGELKSLGLGHGLSALDLATSLIKDTYKSNPGFLKDIQYLEKRYQNEGISFLNRTMPSLDKALLNGLSSGRFVCPADFRRRSRKAATPSFLGSLWDQIFDPKTGVLKSDASPEAVYHLRQVLKFFGKQVLPAPQDLIDRQVQDFKVKDEGLGELKALDDEYLKVAQSLFFLGGRFGVVIL